MILLLSVTEADCLGRQHRRVAGATNRHHHRRSAYRASGLVLWPTLAPQEAAAYAQRYVPRQKMIGSTMKLPPARSSFRLAELVDSDLVRRISAEAYVPAYLPVIGVVPKPALEDYSERIGHGQVWILTHDGSPAGVLVLEHGEDWMTVYSIAVRPTFQGLGLGRLLLDWGEKTASAAGVTELRLYTNARMTKNLALYRHCGYDIFNTRPHPSRPGEVLVDLRRSATARL